MFDESTGIRVIPNFFPGQAAMSTVFSVGVLSDSALQAIRRKIDSVPEVSAGWEVFDRRMRAWQAERDDMSSRWREVDERAKQHGGNKVYTRGNFLRFATARATELAFHGAITGSQASFDIASELTSRVCAEREWSAQAGRNKWGSDLWTADYSAATSLNISLAGGEAGEEVELRWRRALLEKGVRPLLSDWIDPETRLHALDSMGHNWWSVCAGGAALGLFCSRCDWPEADLWLDRIADGFVEFFNYPGNVLQNKQRTFGSEGDYIEPVGYLDYTLHHLLLVLDLYREVLGRDLAAELPVLEKIPDYYLAGIQPLRDGFQRLNFGNMGAGSMSIGGSHNPVATWLWFADRYSRGDLLHLIRQMRRLPETLLEFLFWPEDVTESDFSALGQTKIFHNIGTAILRSGYEPDATVFAIKTGEKWNHNHSDAGSFILSSAGREFIVDPGITEYTNALNGSYFWRSDAHNVILHDGRGQNDEMHHLGTKFKGCIAGQLESPGYRYVLADATGPWEGVYQRFYRHVLWIGGCIVMVDDVMAPYVAPWSQLLHYRGEAKTTGAKTEIRNGGQTLLVHHIYPPHFEREIRQGAVSIPVPNPWKHECRIEQEDYLVFQYPAKDRREKFIQVFELPGGRDSRVERLEAENISGVRITTSQKSWEVVCNHLADGRTMHQNSWITQGRWTTDAFLLVSEWSEDGALSSFAMHNGSCAKLDSHILYSSLLKGDLRVRYSGRGTAISSSLSGAASADIALSPQASAERRRVRLASGNQEYELPVAL